MNIDCPKCGLVFINPTSPLNCPCEPETKLDEGDLQFLAGLLTVSYDRFPEDEKPHIGQLMAKLSIMAKELN